ncbi:MAG: hypothetical protein CL672_02935 [Balneola sp.]|nr:hypothetical protein [Balneola sp.]|tara:strand:- start:4471 stop:5742 length:1272 start_codon:yes stop_codon:yes gene_type:complete
MDSSALPNSNQKNSNKLHQVDKIWTKQAKDRALLLQKHLIEWFDNEQSGMRAAIKQSILGTDFTSEDIDFQLSSIKSRLEAGDLVHWVEQYYGEKDQQELNKKRVDVQDDIDSQLFEQAHVLCIHAGNLPLVGLQDAIAVLLSGHNYTGKISRKDPYLLVSILKWLVHRGWEAQIQHWTIETKDIPAKDFKKVLFAGSESSLESLKAILIKAQILDKRTNWLNRTASFSIAYCPNKELAIKHSNQLIEAMLRHDGKGCRSVGMIVSPVGLNELQKPLENALKTAFYKTEIAGISDSKVQTQGFNRNRLTSVAYKQAYNLAIDRAFICVGDWFIEEHSLEYVSEPKSNRVVYWVKADKDALGSLVERFGFTLQSIYYLGADIPAFKGFFNDTINVESIDYAQCPPLYWKPDGVDILRYLCPFII